MEAAGHELRRAHQLWSDEFRAPWSHGDAGTNNLIYDEKTGRARADRFRDCPSKIAAREIAARGRPTCLSFGYTGFSAHRQWLVLVLAFLNAYDNAPLIAQLKNELAVPTGGAWIWWGVRTSFANPARVKRRLQEIAGVVADLEHYRAFAAKRARKTRRASITCHATRPGIPRINSRTRAIKESAKAASPGIPSKLPTTT